jgi:hypothetical protein
VIKHRRVRGRDLHDPPQHLADGLRAADHVLELVALAKLAREELHLARQPPVLERPLDLHQELLLGEGLLDVVEGAEPHRLHRALDGAVRGHHDDLGVGLLLLHRAEHPEPVDAPHPKIREHDVVGALRAHLGPFLSLARLVDLVARAPQHHRERGPHVSLIINDENLRHSSPSRPTAESAPRALRANLFC